MTAMSISTRYKIQKKDLAATLDAIKRVGFDEALKLAFNGSLMFLQKEPSNPISTTYLAWSVNLLTDARGAKQEADRDKFYQLSKFYRTLAHRIYWKQRIDGTISVIKDFIQLAQSPASKKG